MQQYFVDKAIHRNDNIQFNDEQSHHIMRVMRMKENDWVRIVDADSNAYFASLHFSNGNVTGKIEEVSDKICENPVKIILLMGMIKKDKWDLCLQKACECGVHTIVPFISSRSVVQLSDTTSKKVERWNKIAMEACEQCKRNHLVEVYKPMSFKEAIKHVQADLNLIAYEDANIQAESLKKVLKNHTSPHTIAICIGVEGGFDEKEIEFALQNDYQCISLGGRILRAETAAMALLSHLCYEYELEE